MDIQQKVQHCLEQAVAQHECAGITVLVRKNDREVFYAAAGHANAADAVPVQRDHIFRLYSQSKPITAAAVMILMERGLIDLMDGVDRFLPGFANPRVMTSEGAVPAARPVRLMELLGMTAGLAYPDGDPVGQQVARVFEENEALIRAGSGMGTVEFCNRLGQIPLCFQPGSHWRYATCADVLGAVVEVVSGKPFDEFLKDELFTPLGMKDTDFWVPEDKQARLATCYRRVPGGLEEYHHLHLAVGDYTRRPAFCSGGAGLVSTLDDYAAFAQMLLNGGEYQGQRILQPDTVRFMTQAQLLPAPQADMWDSLNGYGYGKLMRVCQQPGQYDGLARLDEYGWDGWLGSYFANFPREQMTILSMQNTTDTGTARAMRMVRNLVLAAEGNGEL